MIGNSVVYLISAAIAISAFYIQGQEYMRSLVRGQLIQSLIIAAASFLLAYYERSMDLLILGILLIVLRGILVTYFLLRQIPRRRSYLYERNVSVPALLLVDLVFVVIATFLVYSLAFSKIVPHSVLQNSSVLLFPLILFFQGLFLITSRRGTITQVVGYVEEENALILFGLFLLPVPIIIEASVFLDVLALVVISTVVTQEKDRHEPVEELKG
ncbi:MAG: hypothetical protein M1616_01065 [Candidatus Thermoplasmatota archaeon]|jgi:Hydrogenase 4 membrane component (E)|nr:hypothetical protein [Candidatus Thermoplasmatota archaeon]